MQFRNLIDRRLLGAIVIGLLAAGCAGPSAVPTPAQNAASPRKTFPFDAGWRFLQSDAPSAQSPGFDDSAWRLLNVPHDWSIAGPFDPDNPTGGAGGFLPSGVGWYRKHFSSGLFPAGSRVYVEFDGVMANSDVWINGFHLGTRPYGYVGFAYELTGHLTDGPDSNVIAVRADNSAQPASRWYTGAGVYRHVRLVVENPVHIERGSTFVTVPRIEAHGATVHVHTTVINQSAESIPVYLVAWVAGPLMDVPVAPDSPSPAVHEVGPGQKVDLDTDLVVPNPARWDIDTPNVYSAKVKILSRGEVLDREEANFGIREARFEAATGFWLNGTNIKIKGVCVHGDGGAFGAAVPLGVWQQRLAVLKDLGVNAIRTAHNPPDPGFLDLCDRMGFLVMDEMFDCWTVAKNPYDYHLSFNEWSKVDTRDTVRRDRNHPSIILWSAGNEIHDTPQAELSKRILSGLVTVFHENDPTRPVTQALFRPNISHDYDDGLADLLDVIGTNYRNSELLAAHAARPERKIIGTEMGQALDVWKFLRDNPPLSGQFLWVGIDYLGESPRWPYIGGGGDQSGLVDRTGFPKPHAYQRQSWWDAHPMVHIARRIAPEVLLPADPGYGNPPKRRPAVLLCDWTPASAAPHEESVEVYSNAERVELLLNGQSLGSRAPDKSGAPLVWKVPFQPGTLRALASVEGRQVAVDELRTAGAPARIALAADSESLAPGWDNVDFVRATIVDAEGVPVPDAANLVTFHVEGPGAVAAVDNADNSSHEPFLATQRTSYRGSCCVVLRATGAAGSIGLSASSAGLQGAALSIAAASGTP
jgi:beta-galactosidase